MKFSSLFFVVSFLVSVSIYGQSKPAQPELESGTIESQFSYIIEKSSSFKDFQLIRKASILKVKSNALDSLKVLRKKAVTSDVENNKLVKNITSLNKEVASLKEEIVLIAEDKDSISLFGNNMEKAVYNTLLWSIIVVLFLGMLFFMFRFKRSNTVTKSTKNQLDKTETEFEAYRKKALKKEQEIMRKLQDEINKNNI